jgi:hypothetical protein
LEGTGAQEGEVAVLPPDVFDAEGRSADRDAPAHVWRRRRQIQQLVIARAISGMRIR